ncbi:MAG: penicillin-binding transpeptidase domain-containing protein, partial [Pseudomonadota bacterium]
AIKANQYVHAPATYRLGRQLWHDHTQSGQGYIEVREALERSSNVFFYKLGRTLGPDTMALYAKALGLGDRTGIPIRGEVRGHVPTKAWKQARWGEPWQEGESVNTGIGQGHVLVTTIQLAQAYSAIAGNGAVYKPQIIKRMTYRNLETSRSESKIFEPILLRNMSKDTDADYFVKKEHFKTVQQGLWRVVNGPKGTAQKTRFEKPFAVAGKTGTAQVRRFSADQIYKNCANRPKKHRHNGWFVGYGSVEEKPHLTVAVFTEHSCTSAAAVPIAKEVFSAYFRKYHNMRVAHTDD